MYKMITMLRRLAIATIIAATSFGTTAIAQDAAEAPMVEVMSLGAEDAPITMIEYASFTCPHCANFEHDVLPEIIQNYVDSGQLRLVYRPIYFDRLGLWADMLARCGGQEKFFGLSGLVYDKQSEWTDGDTAVAIVDNLYAIGRLAGLDDEMMEACMLDNDMATALVEQSTADADADGINSTPSFVINGEAMSNAPYGDFVARFEEILAE